MLKQTAQSISVFVVSILAEIFSEITWFILTKIKHSSPAQVEELELYFKLWDGSFVLVAVHSSVGLGQKSTVQVLDSELSSCSWSLTYDVLYLIST